MISDKIFSLHREIRNENMENTFSLNTAIFPDQEMLNDHVVKDHIWTLVNRLEKLTDRFEAIGNRVEAV